jgi:hypothetical protein
VDNSTLIVISYYAARAPNHLDSLLSQLKLITNNIIIIINDDNVIDDQFSVYYGLKCIRRNNIGMNIGAWWSGFNNFPNYKYYIFLQDECVILNNNFIDIYKSLLDNNQIGLVGESINFKWDKSWSELSKSFLNYRINNDILIPRVDFYLDMFKKWDISPGTSGIHMRSLVWGLSHLTLEKIGPFPFGRSKEECIAAEIAVSKKIESLGLSVQQSSPSPFFYIKHIEWQSDGLRKISQ